jgi:hypothetical protein
MVALTLAGCARSEAPASSRGGGEPRPPTAAVAQKPDATPNVSPKSSRRVIRRAELAIEVASPARAESEISRLVERLGGYIESSERDLTADEGQRSEARVALSLRVPSERLEAALRELKRLGSGAETEKIGSEDVTDEYIDVDARVTNQRHLEQQLAALLSQATSVESALKVHQELANVRTEIDRLQGRKRFLETESSLAKISLSLSPLRPLVSANSSEFGVSVRRAAADSVAVGAGVITFAIRATGVLAPLAVMFGLPALGVFLWWRRRRS